MGHLYAAQAYMHLYINGVYWGVYNPVERPDETSVRFPTLGGRTYVVRPRSRDR